MDGAAPPAAQPPATRRGDDLRWLALACDLAALCPPSATAFSVGAVIVDADGRELARGFSREADPHAHAEETALAKLGADPWAGPPAPVRARLAGATLYSSLEPCGRRRSRPRTCADLILAAGIPRVVFAWREPSLFVEGEGGELLRAKGVRVVELPELAGRAREPNAHLLP
ncbi:dCMP deaminase [Actinomadura sp. NPDC047616]|uniref:dCMP deaminase n=1 Tax=Actinomadura sp. NPDC047616 TaxID=3155914 RepID=UPI0033C725F5